MFWHPTRAGKEGKKEKWMDGAALWRKQFNYFKRELERLRTGADGDEIAGEISSDKFLFSLKAL